MKNRFPMIVNKSKCPRPADGVNAGEKILATEDGIFKKNADS